MLHEPALRQPAARKWSRCHQQARAIKSWVRELLALSDDAVLSVSELACHVPGCPLKEIVILVMRAAKTARPRFTRQLRT